MFGQEEGRRKKEEGRRKKEEGRKSRVSEVIKNILNVGRGCDNTKRLLWFKGLLNKCFELIILNSKLPEPDRTLPCLYTLCSAIFQDWYYLNIPKLLTCELQEFEFPERLHIQGDRHLSGQFEIYFPGLTPQNLAVQGGETSNLLARSDRTLPESLPSPNPPPH